MPIKSFLFTFPLINNIAFVLGINLLIPSHIYAQSPGTQALTKEDLNRINNQTLAPSAKNPAGLGKKEELKPSFEYTDSTGTQIREYRENNLPTEIEVKSTFGTYEMSPPSTVMPTSGMQQDNLISVPSIRIPLN